MGSKNDFRKKEAISRASHRLFVNYKSEFATGEKGHGAHYSNGKWVKYYYNYKGQTPEDLAEMIVDYKHAGHYIRAALYENNMANGDILRLWDHNSRELPPFEVKKINAYLKFKRKQQ